MKAACIAWRPIIIAATEQNSDILPKKGTNERTKDAAILNASINNNNISQQIGSRKKEVCLKLFQLILDQVWYRLFVLYPSSSSKFPQLSCLEPSLLFSLQTSVHTFPKEEKTWIAIKDFLIK